MILTDVEVQFLQEILRKSYICSEFGSFLQEFKWENLIYSSKKYQDVALLLEGDRISQTLFVLLPIKPCAFQKKRQQLISCKEDQKKTVNIACLE